MKHRIIRWILSLGVLACLMGAAPATQPAARPLDRHEKAIVAYEAKDQQSPPPQGATLFIGSSTFTMWKTIEEDLKPIPVINRGFGGSTIPEVIHYMDRIVLPYKPGRIVFYTGGNDIAGGASAEKVFADFKTFVEKSKAALPNVQIYFVSSKTAPVRIKFAATVDRFNDLVIEYVKQTPGLHFIDTRPLLVNEQGGPREELYLKDRLHMNRAGYELWIPVIKSALSARQEAK